MKTAQYRALLAIITITLVSCGGATDNKASQSETTIPPQAKLKVPAGLSVPGKAIHQMA